MTAISSFTRALAFGIACFVMGAAIAIASCSHTTLEGFIPKFKSARDAMPAQPGKSYSDLALLDQQISACLHGETDQQLRFKLTLVEVGLRAYVGAADALRGNLSRGNATAQTAMQDAKRLVRDNRSSAANLQLAEQLVSQCQRPLAIISKLETHRR